MAEAVLYVTGQLYQMNGENFLGALVKHGAPSVCEEIVKVRSETMATLIATMASPLNRENLFLLRLSKVPSRSGGGISLSDAVKFIASVILYDPLARVAAKHLEVLRLVLPELAKHGSPESWIIPFGYVSLIYDTTPKKENKKIKLELNDVPFVNKLEYVKLMGSLSQYSVTTYLKCTAVLHTVVENLLYTSSQYEDGEILWFQDYVNTIADLSPDAEDLKVPLQSLVPLCQRFMKDINSWSGAYIMAKVLASLPRKQPLALKLFVPGLTHTALEVLMQPRPPLVGREHYVNLICRCMEMVPVEVLPQIPVRSFAQEEYARFLLHVVIPCGLELGREAFTHPETAKVHWFWLITHVLPALQLVEILDVVLLAFKALLIRGDTSLDMHWPNVTLFLTKLFELPAGPHTTPFLEFLDFLVEVRPSLYLFMISFIRRELLRLPVAGAEHKDIIKRIQNRVLNAKAPPTVLESYEKLCAAWQEMSKEFSVGSSDLVE